MSDDTTTTAEPVDPPQLHLVGDLELAAPLPTLEEMLEAVPLNVTIADNVDLDSGTDPSLTDSGRRLCIAERRAGGRCTAAATADSLLCFAHSGRLDASSGGKALAERRREARMTEEERARLARLGTRGVIADTLASNPAKVREAVLVLLQDAAMGDKVAAKALIPWLNQGLGMPTETVQLVEPQSEADVRGMTTEQLQAYVASRRAARTEQAS